MTRTNVILQQDFDRMANQLKNSSPRVQQWLTKLSNYAFSSSPIEWQLTRNRYMFILHQMVLNRQLAPPFSLCPPDSDDLPAIEGKWKLKYKIPKFNKQDNQQANNFSQSRKDVEKEKPNNRKDISNQRIITNQINTIDDQMQKMDENDHLDDEQRIQLDSELILKEIQEGIDHYLTRSNTDNSKYPHNHLIRHNSLHNLHHPYIQSSNHNSNQQIFKVEKPHNLSSRQSVTQQSHIIQPSIINYQRNVSLSNLIGDEDEINRQILMSNVRMDQQEPQQTDQFIPFIQNKENFRIQTHSNSNSNLGLISPNKQHSQISIPLTNSKPFHSKRVKPIYYGPKIFKP